MDLDMSHVGAFLSGVAAVITAILSLRSTRKRAERECEKRIDEIRKATREGFDMGRRER